MHLFIDIVQFVLRYPDSVDRLIIAGWMKKIDEAAQPVFEGADIRKMSLHNDVAIRCTLTGQNAWIVVVPDSIHYIPGQFPPAAKVRAHSAVICPQNRFFGEQVIIAVVCR